MRPAHALLAGPAVLAAMGAACNALNGVQDFQEVDAIEAAAPSDAAPLEAALPPATCACATSAPAGWTGPLAIVENAGASAACPPGTNAVFQGHAGLDAPPMCSPCTCGSPEGTPCATLSVFVSDNTKCATECSSQLVGPTCSKVKFCAASQNGYVDADAPPSDAAGCAPDGGAPAPATWARAAAACALAAPDAGACAGGEACGVSGARACVIHAGDLPCPAGLYQAKSVYYAGILDSRACGPCACDPPTGIRCTGGAITLYADPNCTSAVSTLTAGAACKGWGDPAPNGGGMITAPALPEGGACAARGGDAGGSAAPDQPTTACCAP